MIGSWHVITGEYPPQPGGVSDYTHQVCEALAAAGEAVHVWAPRAAGLVDGGGGASSVTVHRLPDHFGPRGLRALSRGIDAAPGPRVVLVQYVPHAFGMRAMNVPLCAWLASRRRDRVLLMVHEVAYPWGWSRRVREQVLALTHRAMATIATHAADRVFVSVPAWQRAIEQIVPRAPATVWLPIPSNVPDHADPGAVAAARASFGTGDGAEVLGHFGTYGEVITRLLDPALRALLAHDPARVAVLIGRGSREYMRGLEERAPELRGRVRATGGMPPERVAAYLRACDILVQPYPDGVTSRRGTAMAGLALGCPVVTNDGELTEDVWRTSGAVGLAAGPDPGALVASAERLLQNRDARAALGARGAAVYRERFSLGRVVEVLREAGQDGGP